MYPSAEIPPLAQDIIALLADVDPCDKPQATDTEDPRGKLIFERNIATTLHIKKSTKDWGKVFKTNLAEVANIWPACWTTSGFA